MTTQVEDKISNNSSFYSNAKEYWSEIPATVDGMLGGFAFISEKDIKESKLLLKQLFRSSHPPDCKYALDCGSGIGRITKYLLSDCFDKVDLVDQNQAFLDQAEKYIGPRLMHKIGNFYCKGLQEFLPDPGKYDVIWIQWVLGHLTDEDVLSFLEACKKGLKSNGVIVIKENITSTDNIEMDDKDSSVTRPLSLLKNLFAKAEFECYRQLKQHGFPNCLYTVYMFVLRPKAVLNSSNDSQTQTNTEDQQSNSIDDHILQVKEHE